MPGERKLERETGIEPATNSLEGCDSTTELLPPTCVRALLSLDRVAAPAGRLTSFIDSAVTRDRCLPRPTQSFDARSERRAVKARAERAEVVEWWRGKDSNLRSR